MSNIDVGKARKILSEAFVQNHEKINEDEAADLVVKAELTIRDLKEERSTDDNLIAAKQVAKDLSAGYGNAIKYEEAKIQYLLAKIQEIQAGDVNPSASV